MSWIDPGLVAGGLVGGFTMGLTGMGGGDLMQSGKSKEPVLFSWTSVLCPPWKWPVRV